MIGRLPRRKPPLRFLSRPRGGERQRKPEGGSVVQLAFDFNRAAERVQYVLDDGQPEAGAADGPVPGFVGALEPVEIAGQVFGGNADAGIPDGKLDPVRFRVGGDPDGTAIRRVFDSVVDQVDQHLFQQVGVGHYQ